MKMEESRKKIRLTQVKRADCGVNEILFEMTWITWILVHQVLFLYNYIPYLFAYFPWRAPNKDTHRKRVSIGENEKKFIVECYNLCHGKEWKEVLMFAKHRVTEVGLPEHVVHMYLAQSTERLTQRNEEHHKECVTLTATRHTIHFYSYRWDV